MEVLGQVQPYMDEVLAHTSDEDEAIDGFGSLHFLSYIILTFCICFPSCKCIEIKKL